MVIGLTGGIGAGKDEAAKVFKKTGAKIIDADKIGHSLLKKNTPVYRKTLKAFGPEVLNKSKEIDRRKLGSIVFKNRKKLAVLNRIIHPAMKEEFKKEITGYGKKGVKFIVLNAAILSEAGWDKLADKTILITAPRELRVKRLQKRGIDRPKALTMISSQWSDAKKRKKADCIIENNGSLSDLKRKILNIVHRPPKAGETSP
jgi:dephospho-CoA kinase